MTVTSQPYSRAAAAVSRPIQPAAHDDDATAAADRFAQPVGVLDPAQVVHPIKVAAGQPETPW